MKEETLDILVTVVLIVLSSVCVGLWQNSLAAGFAIFFIGLFIANI